jgi:hypothetical protein
MYEKGRAQSEVGAGGLTFTELGNLHTAKNPYGIGQADPTTASEITAPGGEQLPGEAEIIESAAEAGRYIGAGEHDELTTVGNTALETHREHHAIVGKHEFIRRAYAAAGADPRVSGRIFNKLGGLASDADSSLPPAERLRYRVQGVDDAEETNYLSLTNILRHPDLDWWGDREREIICAAADSALENDDHDLPNEGHVDKPPAPLPFDAGPEPDGLLLQLITHDEFVTRAVRATNIRPQAAGLLFSRLIASDRNGNKVRGNDASAIGHMHRIGNDSGWAFTPQDAQAVAVAPHTPPRTREVLLAILASREQQTEQHENISHIKDK